jgi:tetratricopeptide (TPR) repeat protein
MAKQRLDHQQAERDEVAEGVHDAFLFLQRNYIWIVALIVVASGVYIGFMVVQQRNALASGEINNSITQALIQLNEITSLTDPERRLAAVAPLVESMDKLVAQYPDHRLTSQAFYLKGRAYFESDQFEKAEEAYGRFANSAPDEESAARADIALGYTYENKSFLVEETSQRNDSLTSALGSYERAASRLPGSYTYYYALLCQARIHELQKNDARAIELYQKVLDERASPMVASAVTVEDDKPTAGSSGDLMNLIRESLVRMETQLSFQKTAQLRLAQLKGFSPDDVSVNTGAPVASP